MKPLRKLSFQKSFSNAGQVKLNIANTIDNAPNAIILLNLMDNAYDKEFKKINTTNEDYPQKLKEHTNLKEWNNKLKDLIMNLTYSMRSPNESTLTIIEQLKSLLNQGITVPEKEKFIYKSDDYLRDINNELHKLEQNEYYSENGLKKYSEEDRFKRLKELVEALFYVIRNEQISPYDKIYEFKKEMQEELYEYDQSTYPTRQRHLGPLKFSLRDIFYAYIIWVNDKQYGDTIRLLVFLRYLWLWKETNEALEEFYKRPDINITNKETDIKNDMRHITGLVFYTQKYGAEKARKYGYLKEKLDFYQEGDIQDTFIDFDNNERGIAFGVKYKNLSKEETIEKIYEEFIKNKRKK